MFIGNVNINSFTSQDPLNILPSLQSDFLFHLTIMPIYLPKLSQNPNFSCFMNMFSYLVNSKYTILYYAIPYTIRYYTTILYYTILYYTILYDTIRYYTIPYYTILYYTILYHYTIPVSYTHLDVYKRQVNVLCNYL